MTARSHIDRVLAAQAIRPLAEKLEGLLDRLTARNDAKDHGLIDSIIDALRDNDDGSRLSAYITQAEIALGDVALPPVKMRRMMTDEEAQEGEKRRVLYGGAFVPIERAPVKAVRTYQCTACLSEVPYTKFHCPDCGARVLTDDAVRALVLAARDALTATVSCVRWCIYCGHPDEADITPMPHTETCWVPALRAAVALVEGRP